MVRVGPIPVALRRNGDPPFFKDFAAIDANATHAKHENSDLPNSAPPPRATAAR